MHARTQSSLQLTLLKRSTTAHYLYMAGPVTAQRVSLIVLHSPARGLFLLLTVVVYLDVTIQGVAFDCGFQGDRCNVFPEGFVYHFLTDPVRV